MQIDLELLIKNWLTTKAGGTFLQHAVCSLGYNGFSNLSSPVNYSGYGTKSIEWMDITFYEQLLFCWERIRTNISLKTAVITKEQATGLQSKSQRGEQPTIEDN